jgi:hypothetical protein
MIRSAVRIYRVDWQYGRRMLNCEERGRKRRNLPGGTEKIMKIFRIVGDSGEIQYEYVPDMSTGRYGYARVRSMLLTVDDSNIKQTSVI